MNLPEFDSLDSEELALLKASMPSAMAPVVKLLGLKNAVAFMRAFPGQTFVMPKHQTGAGWARFLLVRRAVGIEAALQLAKEFGGEKLTLPRLAQAMRRMRNRRIIRDFDAATKEISAANAVNDLAAKYQMTSRSIETIVNGKTP